jgi:hypothetical protein
LNLASPSQDQTDRDKGNKLSVIRQTKHPKLISRKQIKKKGSNSNLRIKSLMSSTSKKCTFKTNEKLPKMINNGEVMASTVKFDKGESFLANLE